MYKIIYIADGPPRALGLVARYKVIDTCPIFGKLVDKPTY